MPTQFGQRALRTVEGGVPLEGLCGSVPKITSQRLRRRLRQQWLLQEGSLRFDTLDLRMPLFALRLPQVARAQLKHLNEKAERLYLYTLFDFAQLMNALHELGA